MRLNIAIILSFSLVSMSLKSMQTSCIDKEILACTKAILIEADRPCFANPENPYLFQAPITNKEEGLALRLGITSLASNTAEAIINEPSQKPNIIASLKNRIAELVNDANQRNSLIQKYLPLAKELLTKKQPTIPASTVGCEYTKDQ